MNLRPFAWGVFLSVVALIGSYGESHLPPPSFLTTSVVPSSVMVLQKVPLVSLMISLAAQAHLDLVVEDYEAPPGSLPDLYHTMVSLTLRPVQFLGTLIRLTAAYPIFDWELQGSALHLIDRRARAIPGYALDQSLGPIVFKGTFTDLFDRKPLHQLSLMALFSQFSGQEGFKHPTVAVNLPTGSVRQFLDAFVVASKRYAWGSTAKPNGLVELGFGIVNAQEGDFEETYYTFLQRDQKRRDNEATDFYRQLYEHPPLLTNSSIGGSTAITLITVRHGQVFTDITVSGQKNEFPHVMATLSFHGSLWKSIMYIFIANNAPEKLSLQGLPDEVKVRIQRFIKRNKQFRSQIEPLEKSNRDKMFFALEKRRGIERSIVSLMEAPGIEKIAAEYARNASIAYEWEGMSDGPMGEAAYAESFLEKNPESPLRPYLWLFLMHRYRCAFEALENEKKTEKQTTAAQKYRMYLSQAKDSPHLLTHWAAEDMDQEPFIDFQNAGHPTLSK